MFALRAFAHPDRIKATPFTVDFFGTRYSGSLDNYIDWLTFFQGGFAQEELSLLAALCKAAPGPITFYDVGANVGHHTLFMCSRATQVVAFEPFPAVRAEMARKLAAAGATNVLIQPVALGAEDASGKLNAAAGANLGTSSLAHVPDNTAGETITVEVANGDAYIARNALPPISILKMDVEGYEAAALAGLRQTILRDRPPMLIEISGKDRSGFIDEGGLRKAIYPNALIYEVGAKRGRHRLLPFDMRKASEILVLPEELGPLILPGRRLIG